MLTTEPIDRRHLVPSLETPVIEVGKIFDVRQAMNSDLESEQQSWIWKNIAKHPALVFGLGLVTGYLVYKYRKEIIASSTKVVDAGKDFVLQQKENLEDIVAEIQEDAN